MCDLTYYSKFDQILEQKSTLEFASRKKQTRDKFFAILNHCLNSMKDEFRLILEKTYFKKDYEFWWMDYFCKSSYYRKRYLAVVSFVTLYEFIYENISDYSTYINSAC